MIERLPFYMVYQQEMDVKETSPAKGLNEMNSRIWDVGYRDEENMTRHDYDYMKSAYPDTAKRIMPYVEEECDRLEYSGSMIFDEYPDQLQLRMLCRRIYRKVLDKEYAIGERDGIENKCWLFELVQVMTYHEILRRRSEYRRYRKNFY